MKTKDLHQKTEKELNELLIDNRYKLGKLKFDLSSKKIKNVREIRDLRRDVAKILTILNEKNVIKKEEE